MKRSKFLFSIVVVLAVLTLVVSTALAQGGSPWGMDYQLPASEDTGTPDLSMFTPLSENYELEPMVGIQFVTAQPISPKNNYIFTKTPKFVFTKVPSATQYRIAVYDITASALVYEFTGPGTCPPDVGYCWLQPVKRLKTLQYEATKGGVYLWGVKAYEGSWPVDYSAPQMFIVLSTGFNSTFDLNTKNWFPVYGSWSRVDPGYYKTLGVTMNATSAAQKEFFMDNFVYEVTMKRKGSTQLNDLEFHGTPDPIATQHNWIAGYLFGYDNSKAWRLTLKTYSGTFETLATATSEFIKPYGWNTLTVWTDTPYIHLWINGGYLGSYSNSAITSGYVGVRMYKSSSVDVKEPLFINSAKLYYSAMSPYAITSVEPSRSIFSLDHESLDETVR